MNINNAATSIKNLIQINYERMASFDKASRLTTDEELKSYFESKADESEQHIEELQTMVSEPPETAAPSKSFLPSCKVFDQASSLKKIPLLIDSARSVEKHMLEWYQKMIEGLTHLPSEFGHMLRTQLESIKQGQSQLKNLKAALI